MLAARQDRQRDLAVLGRREHEHNLGRRLLERLEQGVPGLRRQHVDFVDDVDLVPVAGRGVTHGLAQLADGVDAAVAGTVDLQDVERAAGGDFGAGGAAVAGPRRRPFLAVERLGEEACHGRLAHAPQARKEIRVVDAVLRHGVLEGRDDRRLADDLLERLGAILAREDLIAQGQLTFRESWGAGLRAGPSGPAAPARSASLLATSPSRRRF